MFRRRLLTALPIAVACATALAAVAAPATAATPSRSYVALGDSYAAGFGLPLPALPTFAPVPGCAQTTLDYPHLVATALHIPLTDVSCSGAVTADFTSPQVVPGGSAPAQLDAVRAVQPSLVSITIGGNDLGFSAIAADCLAATPAGPLLTHPGFSSCKSYFTSTAPGGGKAGNPFGRLASVTQKVKAAVTAVRAAAPNARIIVIGYPAILPDAAHTPAGGCFAALAAQGGGILPSALPFTDVDVPYLQLLEQQLDAGIASAVGAAGAQYSDIYPSSLAHSACSPESTRWVEPVIPGGGGTNVLHPSIRGTGAMAIRFLTTFITTN